MPREDDLSRSLTPFEQASTLVAVVEPSQSSWLVAGIVPGLARHPLKKLEPDQEALLRVLRRWQEEAAKARCTVARIAVAFEAGRDGFWLARWLRARGVEAHVIRPTSVAVSREHRRAKTDRLDTELLKRSFLGWLRGEPDHCGMAAVPTLEDEDARRPTREREGLVGERTRIVNRVKAGKADGKDPTATITSALHLHSEAGSNLAFGQFAKESMQNQRLGSNGSAQPTPLRSPVFSWNWVG